MCKSEKSTHPNVQYCTSGNALSPQAPAKLKQIRLYYSAYPRRYFFKLYIAGDVLGDLAALLF
jgi:hypothetical protein